MLIWRHFIKKKNNSKIHYFCRTLTLYWHTAQYSYNSTLTGIGLRGTTHFKFRFRKSTHVFVYKEFAPSS